MLLGVDVGGTFTDAVLFDGRLLHTAKAPTTPEDQSRGVLAAVEAALGRVAASTEDVDAFARPVLENSFTTKSVGGFANVRVMDGLLAGGGVNWTAQTDTFLAASSTLNDFTSHLQCFGAVQYRPLGQLYIKLVLGYARAGFLPSDLAVAEWQNSMYSGRIRLLYLY